MTKPTNEDRAREIVEKWAWQESDGPLNEDFKQLSAAISSALEDAVKEERERRKTANADEIAMILSENEDASPAYLAVQICERIENA